MQHITCQYAQTVGAQVLIGCKVGITQLLLDGAGRNVLKGDRKSGRVEFNIHADWNGQCLRHEDGLNKTLARVLNKLRSSILTRILVC